ncbi:MAG: hypothetical protein ACTSRW_00095 [Candidatus Helarchaeota archaeon]
MVLVNNKILTELNRLDSLIKSEMDRSRIEAEKKFERKLTKEAINYAYLLFKEKVEKIIKEEIERFKIINIVVDYSTMPEKIDDILKCLNDVKVELIETFPNPDKVIINPRDEIKRIILSMPIEWNVEIIEKYKKLFLKKLRFEEIVPAK